MDLEDDVRRTVRRLARPRPAPDALTKDVLNPAVAGPRKGRRSLSILGAVVVVILAIAAPLLVSQVHHGSSVKDSTGGGWVARRVAPALFVGSYGVRVGIQVAFDDSRVLTAGRVSGARADGPVQFTPNDGTDNDAGYPTPLRIPNGTTANAEANLFPDCGHPRSATPRFVIESRNDKGSHHRNTVSVASTPSWRAAVIMWCSKGVQVLPGSSTTKVNGDQTRVLTIINPGPQPVTVVSTDTRHRGHGWAPARTKVAPATRSELVVKGSNTRGAKHAPLLVNGQVFRPKHRPAT